LSAEETEDAEKTTLIELDNRVFLRVSASKKAD
jgi:hypothetical protein